MKFDLDIIAAFGRKKNSEVSNYITLTVPAMAVDKTMIAVLQGTIFAIYLPSYESMLDLVLLS